MTRLEQGWAEVDRLKAEVERERAELRLERERLELLGAWKPAAGEVQ